MQPTICLNMIVKNESHVIRDTLENLCQYFNFVYWVICDTGSSDGTQGIIRDFFGEKGISGELLEHEWRDFGHNRTLALQAAYGKTDYLLIFDADDRIVGDFQLPREMNAACYYLRIGKEFSYKRMNLVNNRIKWCYRGVLHEYIHCLENVSHTPIDIVGNYYIESRRSGSRNSDPLKYHKDAQILKNAYEAEQDVSLKNRYAFYCAQSFKDAGKIKEAIDWYKLVVSLNTWEQEKFYSCLMLAKMYRALADEPNMIYYCIKGYSITPTRVETLYELINYYRHKGENRLCELYYNTAKNIKNPGSSALFNANDVYEYKLDEEYTIFSYYLGNRNIDEYMYRLAKDGRVNINLLMSNSNFYTENKLKLIKDAEGVVRLVEKRWKFPSKEERSVYKTSKNILFLTGYCDRPWNSSYSKTHSLGGSEKAVAYLSELFPRDYTIYVAGGVHPETVDNVVYVNNDKLKNLLETTTFHTVVCSRYVGLLDKYADLLNFYQLFIWAHDTGLIRTDTTLTTEQLLEKWDEHIDGCVCLTQWHADLFKKTYPTLKNKITIINNGIVTNYFNQGTTKIKNRFIYSSRTERGLARLLEIWPSILSSMPDASLIVFGYNAFPSTELDYKIKELVDKYPSSIRHLGQLNAAEMYEQMALAEYWLYPTNWQETSCITALEMLASGVICIYYPVAGLNDTIGEHGIKVYPGNEVVTIVGLSDSQKEQLRNNGRNYALSCSWKNRANAWMDMLKINLPFKIVNLERRPDRKEKMIKEFEKQGIYVSDHNFFKAIDGHVLKLNTELQRLFKQNNFNYRKGVVGVALSHFELWKQLVADKQNDFYIICEDDITLSDNFYKHINEWHTNVTSMPDFTFFGYSMYNRQPSNTNEQMRQIKLRKDLFIGGFFCYAITKHAAKKMVDYINENGIKVAIDCIVKYTDVQVECVEIVPHIAFTDFYTSENNIDTDIQNCYECVDIDERLITDNYVFLKNMDQEGRDICNQGKMSLNQIILTALDDDKIVCFNTNKWVKHSLIELTPTQGHGLYVKKQAYLTYLNYDKDFELIMEQCNVTREEAQSTLLKNNGDVVESIIQLTNLNV